MTRLTEEEAARLDELYTKNPPDIDLDRPGIITRMRQETTPVSIGALDAVAFDAKLEKGYADMNNGRVRAKKDIFTDMKRDYDL